MEQLKAESSEKKRTGILLQFLKAQVGRDKSFKVVPVDSLPEEEQEELHKLLKQRKEIWGSTLWECTFDDVEHIDWSGCESQEIDDELRRRGRLVEVPSTGIWSSFLSSKFFQLVFIFAILCVLGLIFFVLLG